jgi:L-seryl-tRNA(Ser) seleniumtransferase
VLAESARKAVADAAAGHTVLEIDTATGQRGSRQEHVRGLLCELTGAESALVVNNNAGATFLAVAALAAGREVIISRGELVEIGGSFRMPDIIRASGAVLVEVGTTNRTRLSDFEAAISERTGLLLRCHPSNFKIVGFTEETLAADLARLGRDRGVLVMDDLGSGALLDLEAAGAGPTTTLRAAVASGCDIVTASGDKLLGGPQAGLIVGRRQVVERIARHPLARALRVDKLTLAALEATLRLYRDPAEARAAIPTLAYLSRTAAVLESMAVRLKAAIEAAATDRCRVDLVTDVSHAGGGSLPGEDLPTTCVRVRLVEAQDSVGEFAARLRAHRPAVFGRVRGDALLLDPRTLEESEFTEVAEAIRATVCTDPLA